MRGTYSSFDQTIYYDQWREMELVEAGDGHYVQVTVWRRQRERGATGNPVVEQRTARLRHTGPATSATEDDFVAIERTIPTRRGVPLNEIPFVFHGASGPYAEVTRPPLEDMADINLSMYRTSADLENARHVIGVPTPYACGFTDGKKTDLYLGSSTVLVTTETSAHCGFLEFSGSGLSSLTDAIEEAKKEMATLGARMLDEQNAVGGEAYATVALRQVAETAALLKMARSLSQSLTDVLAFADWWSNTQPTPEECQVEANIELNTDFTGDKMAGDAVQHLVQSFIAGGISLETLFYNLQQGEVIPPDVTFEMEKSRLKESHQLLLEMEPPPPPVVGLDPRKLPVAPGVQSTKKTLAGPKTPKTAQR